MSKIDVATRERVILKNLKENTSTGASVRELYDYASKELSDTVTLQAYYKIIDRMEAAGKVEVLTEDPSRGRVYRITETLHTGNPITLDDVYEMLPFVATTEAIARVVDAQDYFEENLHTVVRKAAEGLLVEDPVDLYCRMIQDMIEVIHADQAIITHRDADGKAEIADTYANKRLEQDYRDLEHVAYRGLSIPPTVLRLPGLTQVRDFGKEIQCNLEALRKVLRFRIFGEGFIRIVAAGLHDSAIDDNRHLTVSGSDGSMHAGTLAIRTARGFYEEVSDVITFNNSIVYVRLSDVQTSQQGKNDMVHSAPFTRQTIDDPSYKGMVLVPSLFPDLSESEYEHMTRCATDVVQFRVDEEVFTGKAYDLRPPYSQIPKPQVHIRDGTITPQEREFSHYNRPDPYGEMVREGIRLERIILERIISSGDKGPIFAGAVKSTQMRLFVHALNWYIKRGSKARFGAPIASDWDSARAAVISDNTAMTALLSTLPTLEKGNYYVTCALLRQFPSLTEFYDYDLKDETWPDFFENRRKISLQENKQYGGSLRYHATVDLSDDDYIFMCQNADYVYLYIGHTSGDPAPTIPRYEFLTSLRNNQESNDGWQKVSEKVSNSVMRLVNAIDVVGLSFDRDHNYMSDKKRIKVIPFPIYQAHEYAKTLGRKLESELKSIVVSRLIAIKKLRATTSDSDVEIRPVSIRRYMERFYEARKKLLGDGGDKEDDNR
jgi:hypothetical protein